MLLLKDSRLVKTIRFDEFRDVGSPVTTAKIYDAQRADELLFLDIDASEQGRGTLKEIVQRVSQECFMPLGVGGGIRSIQDIKELLASGADKVVINTAAVEHPEFVRHASRKFGSSTIVVSMDIKEDNGVYRVYTHGGSKATDLDPVTWAKEVQDLGAGELMINSIDRDGVMEGLDIPMIEKVKAAIQIPLIVGGGVGKLDDFKKGFDAGASAVAAGSIFHFTDQSVIKTRKFLVGLGCSVRA